MPALPLGRLASAFALLGALAGPAAAAPQSPHLSSRLAVLASPAVRSADPARQADAVGLARHGFGSLVRSGDRVVAEVHFRSGAAGRAGELRSAGARVLDTSSRDRTVSALVDPADLHALAAADGVRVVTPVLTPMTSAVDGCRGAATSEGDSQLDASALRSALGVDGSGVKVGVLSDSFDIDSSALTSAADDVASGDLPGAGNPCGRTTPVGVLDDNSSWGGEDEGRAMLQIVHDLAPGAGLAFATAFTGQTGFANNIRQLRAAGAKIIADDVTYADEPFFQDGPIAQAVNDVTASGALYFSSAANNNIRVGGNDAGSWETPSFRNAGSCPSGVLGTQTECEDFDPGAGVDKTFDVTVGPGATVTTDLQWAEPWDGVTTDFDLYLLDASGNDLDPLHDQNADPHTGTQEPFEFGQWTNTSASAKTVRIAIVRNSALGDSLSPRLKLILLENGDDVAPAEYL